MTKKLPFHEAANIFPLLEGDEFDELCASIEEHGLRVPVGVWKGKILDGRNRYLACEEVGVEFRAVELNRAEHLGGMSPLEYVLAINLERRHLTVAQRATIAAKVKPLLAKEAQERMSKGGKKSSPGRPTEKGVEPVTPLSEGKARDIAGKKLGVSGPSVDRAEAIQKGGSKALKDAVAAGKVGLTKGAKIVKLPKDRQAGAIKNGKPARTKSQENIHQRQKALAAVGVLVRACDHFDVLVEYQAELERIKRFFIDSVGKNRVA